MPSYAELKEQYGRVAKSIGDHEKSLNQRAASLGEDHPNVVNGRKVVAKQKANLVKNAENVEAARVAESA